MTTRGVTKERIREKAEKEVSAFNAANPMGTMVNYWKGRRAPNEPPSGQGKLRTEAYVDEAGQAVVFIEGCRGYMALSHVEPVA